MPTGDCILAEERGACEVPKEFLSSIQIQAAYLKGLVDFRLTATSAKLIIGGIVGHIPLSNSVTLVIRPKFPLSNMSRMVWLSRVSISKSVPVNRFYELARNETYSLEVMLRLFSLRLSELLVQGVHRQYLRKHHASSPHAKIDFQRTQQRYWSRGVFSSAMISEFVLSNNVQLNSLIRYAAEVATKHCARLADFTKETKVFRDALDALSGVSSLKLIPQSSDLHKALESIPSFRSAYRDVVPIAVELIGGSSIWLDRDSTGIFAPSFLVNLETVFEGYVRNSLHEQLRFLGAGVSVVDGNKPKWSSYLFSDSRKYEIKPDLIFRSSNAIKLIGDVKYKTRSHEEDRYQIITHALSMGCAKAILIYPASEKVRPGLRRLGELGPSQFKITVFEYGLSLDGDLSNSEMEMAEHVSGIL